MFWHAGIIVDHEQGMKFALDIAKGMEYLHSLDQLIPRLYLKSTHIMVRIKWYPWVLWSYIVHLFSLATEMKINKWDNNHSGKHCLYFFELALKPFAKVAETSYLNKKQLLTGLSHISPYFPMLLAKQYYVYIKGELQWMREMRADCYFVTVLLFEIHLSVSFNAKTKISKLYPSFHGRSLEILSEWVSQKTKFMLGSMMLN